MTTNTHDFYPHPGAGSLNTGERAFSGPPSYHSLLKLLTCIGKQTEHEGEGVV